MKIFSLLIASLMLLLVSCSDDSNSPSDASGLRLGQMTATIDGKPFKSNLAQAKLLGNSTVQIGAANTSGEMITLVIPSTSVGTFSTGQAFLSIVPPSNPTQGEYYFANFITYTITSYQNNEIAGSFSFIGRQETGDKMKNVDDVRFRAKLISQQ